VVNPRAGGGVTASRLRAIEAAAHEVFGACDCVTTNAPDHATALTRQAVADGVELVVAVGGDGTANEVVNGLVSHGENHAPGVVFGLVNAGTGGDLVKTLGVPAGLREAMTFLRDAVPRPTDVLDVKLTGNDGAPLRRACINVAGFGMQGEVVRRANAGSKRFGGRATFLGATLRTVLDYRPTPVRLSWTDADGVEDSWEGALSSAFVANGHYCGGGMWVGRGGSIRDGLVDVTVLPSLPLIRLALGVPRLFTGTIAQVPGVHSRRVQHLVALSRSESKVLVDLDGEQAGVLPVEIEVMPSILLVAGQ